MQSAPRRHRRRHVGRGLFVQASGDGGAGVAVDVKLSSDVQATVVQDHCRDGSATRRAGRRRIRLAGRRWVLVSWMLLAFGCGGESDGRISVHGGVTLDGEPVPSGSISFLPAAGTSGPSATGRIENGTYEIPARLGPTAGEYTATIQLQDFSAAGIPTQPGQLAQPGRPVEPGRPGANFLKGLHRVPVKIQPGQPNEIDFPLEGR